MMPVGGALLSSLYATATDQLPDETVARAVLCHKPRKISVVQMLHHKILKCTEFPPQNSENFALISNTRCVGACSNF
jgi:hypothetical protein